MPVRHEFWLVALSIAIAIQGAYVGLSLAVQVAEAAGVRRRLLLAGAAFSLAVAIWAMHFVGMLAVRLPFPIDYLVLPTLLSFLVCVIVVGAGIFAASAGPPTPLRLAAAATFMGLGIVSMHYLGMSALHASAHMHHDPIVVAASVAVAIAVSGLALFLAGGKSGRPPLILSATALGFAIAGMHYTAMAGLTVMPHAEAASGAPTLSTDLLAIVVAVVAFAVSGIFLLTLVPDRKGQRGSAPADMAAFSVATGEAFAASPSPPVKVSPPIAVPHHPPAKGFEEGRATAVEKRPLTATPPGSFRSCARARRISCRSAISSRFTPTPTTRPSSTERRSSSARFRSARWRRASTMRISCACTAATLSTWNGWSGLGGTGITGLSSCPGMTPTQCRSAAADLAI